MFVEFRRSAPVRLALLCLIVTPDCLAAEPLPAGPAIPPPALAAPAPPALAPAPQATVSPPPGRPAALPAGPRAGAEQAPATPLLEEVGRRQSELAILELDLKRAELQKRLRDLDAVGPIGPPPAFPSGGPAAGPAPDANVGAAGPAGTAQLPAVRRVHRVGGQLKALVAMPSGELRDLAKGASLGDHLHIAEISSDLVLVQAVGGDVFPLAGSAQP